MSNRYGSIPEDLTALRELRSRLLAHEAGLLHNLSGVRQILATVEERVFYLEAAEDAYEPA